MTATIIERHLIVVDPDEYLAGSAAWLAFYAANKWDIPLGNYDRMHYMPVGTPSQKHREIERISAYLPGHAEWFQTTSRYGVRCDFGGGCIYQASAEDDPGDYEHDDSPAATVTAFPGATITEIQGAA